MFQNQTTDDKRFPWSSTKNILLLYSEKDMLPRPLHPFLHDGNTNIYVTGINKFNQLFSVNSSSLPTSSSNKCSQSSEPIISNCASTSIFKRERKTLACFFNSSTSMEIRRDLANASLMIRSAFFSASLIINLDSFLALPFTSSADSWATRMDLFKVSSILLKCPSLSFICSSF